MENGQNVMQKYGISLGDIIAAMGDGTVQKEIDSAVEKVLAVRKRLEGYASGKQSNYDELVKAAKNNQMSESWFKAQKVFENVMAEVVDSGIMKDSEALVHLSLMMGDWAKSQVPGLIDHNVSRQKNVSKPELISKKQLQTEYAELREGLFKIADLVGCPIKDKSKVPSYTGPVSDSIPVSVQESRFYQFSYKVEQAGEVEVFAAGTPWYEIAQKLELHPFANGWKIADFMAWIEKTYDFDFNDAEKLDAAPNTEVLYGWNLTITKV